MLKDTLLGLLCLKVEHTEHIKRLYHKPFFDSSSSDVSKLHGLRTKSRVSHA